MARRATHNARSRAGAASTDRQFWRATIDHDCGVDEVVIDSIEGRSLKLSLASRPDDDGIWSYMAAMHTEAGRVSSGVCDIGDGLATFFRELADARTGFDGERSYGSLEGQLPIRCSHDGRGTVTCEVTLAQPSPPTWSFTARLDLGAGAHLERIAAEVEGFLPVGR